MAKKVVAVQIGGRDYRLRSDADERWLQSVAEYVDESMGRIRSLTETVDSMDVAVLTALNLARELIELRENGPGQATHVPVDPDRLAALIEMAESALAHDEATAN
jgi:cell division protein ZapA